MQERARDYAIVAAASGGALAAINAGYHGAPVLMNGIKAAALYGAGAASFIGLRHLMLDGRWHEDREGISGLAACLVGGMFGTLRGGVAQGKRSGAAGLLVGCAGHYVHRWWLHARLHVQLLGQQQLLAQQEERRVH